MRVKVEKVVVHADARGRVFEPLAGAELGRFRNVHAVLTEPGAVRGNHYHERGTEVLAVEGPMQVRVREEGVVRDYEVPTGEVWRFTFPPGVAHAMKNVGSQAAWMVGFNTEEHDRAAPDVRPARLLEPDEAPSPGQSEESGNR
ncbi:MAG: hypothetical protein D6766_06715 [Verrucomicrobia bacterium]|nr:MAG: hypothetical protein D6766_06715 [Verrucomicrobiota bacterium]